MPNINEGNLVRIIDGPQCGSIGYVNALGIHTIEVEDDKYDYYIKTRGYRIITDKHPGGEWMFEDKFEKIKYNESSYLQLLQSRNDFLEWYSYDLENRLEDLELSDTDDCEKE